MLSQEDKLRFLQSLDTGKVFTKKYDIIPDTLSVVFRELTGDDLVIINNHRKHDKVDNDYSYRFYSTIAAISTPKVCYCYSPPRELQAEDTSKALYSLVTHINRALADASVVPAALLPNYECFIEVLRVLDAHRANLDFFSKDPVITTILDVVATGAIRLRDLDLDNQNNRDYLAILLNHTKTNNQTIEQVIDNDLDRDEVDRLVEQYVRMTEGRNG